MGTPMFASAPTADGQWYAVRVTSQGVIRGIIPGLFGSKAESDDSARRYVDQR